MNLQEAREIAIHRETYSPDANEHQVLRDWARAREALAFMTDLNDDLVEILRVCCEFQLDKVGGQSAPLGLTIKGFYGVQRALVALKKKRPELFA